MPRQFPIWLEAAMPLTDHSVRFAADCVEKVRNSTLAQFLGSPTRIGFLRTPLLETEIAADVALDGPASNPFQRTVGSAGRRDFFNTIRQKRTSELINALKF